MSKIEEAARAALAAWGETFAPESGWVPPVWGDDPETNAQWVTVVRAVLTSLRTPSEEMVAAGEAVLEDVTSVMDEDHNRRVVRNVVTAAIDSLLKGEGE